MCHLLQAQVFCFVLFTSAAAIPKNIWHVSILEAPAPPADVDTASPHALRDKKYLPAEIAGIFAAYIFFVACLGIALLLVGRRLRRAAQASPKTLAMEMMKPTRGRPSTHHPYHPSINILMGKAQAALSIQEKCGPAPRRAALATASTRKATTSKRRSRAAL